MHQWKESNPQLTVLETGTLPLRYTGNLVDVFSYQRSMRSEDHFPPVRGGRIQWMPFLVSANFRRPATEIRDQQLDLVELDGIEPTTSGLQSPRSPS